MNKKIDFPPNSSLVSSDLLEQVQGFDSHELFWLSGYCAGLASAKKELPATSSDTAGLKIPDRLSEDALGLKTTVIYASQTGNAEELAKTLHINLSQKGLEAELISTDDFKVNKLKQQQILIMVASTHGEGEPPDDAIDFYDFINSKRAPKLDKLRHAVLSLGDSSYEFFCQTGKDFDAAFIQLGSKPLLERLDCDLDYQVSASQWINSVVEEIAALSLTGPSSAALSGSVDINSLVSDKATSALSVEDQFTKDNPFSGTILANQKITGDGSSKPIHHIEISLENSGIQYQPGDSIGIWAKNNLEVVNQIIALTELDPEQPVALKNADKSLVKALLENLEISLISKDFIKKYAQQVRSVDPKNADKFTPLLEQDYASYIKTHQIIDVIAIAPIKLQAQQLVDLLKPIKPRIYSIASSLNANPEEAHLTVGLKQSVNEDATRFGTASHFLIETLKPGDQVLVFIERNHRFKLPSNETPVIMIGPGTGIAPFRSFLQERDERSATGENWLFFGNPNFNTDFLYQLELQKYHKSGRLTRLNVAFSRDQKDKIYVQDRLLENAESVWQWLDEKQASLYVCGDMNRMAKDVHAILVKIVSEQGGKTMQDAEAYLKQLRKENRYQRDVY